MSTHTAAKPWEFLSVGRSQEKEASGKIAFLQCSEKETDFAETHLGLFLRVKRENCLCIPGLLLVWTCTLPGEKL